MSKQHVECHKSNDSFDKVERCFDTVAMFGNNVDKMQQCQTNFRPFDKVETK